MIMLNAARSAETELILFPDPFMRPAAQFITGIVYVALKTGRKSRCRHDGEKRKSLHDAEKEVEDYDARTQLAGRVKLRKQTSC